MNISVFFFIFALNFRIMGTLNRKNHITIAKALGIILMVTCHAGIPNSYIIDFIYMFHMPLFFFSSGYFFKEISKVTDLRQFLYKRISGLYLPFLKYSLFFLFFHNFFYRLHIYNTIYELSDFLRHSIRILSMTEYEELMLRPFWFLKTLLFSSLLIGLLSYLCQKSRNIFNSKLFIPLALAMTILLKFIDFQLLLIGDCGLITLAIAYLYSGVFYKRYESNLRISHPMLVVILLILLIGSYGFPGLIDMRYTTTTNTILYFILSILGIIFVYKISMLFNNLLPTQIKNILYYIGNHTMPILALHLLFFKLGNFIKIVIYNLPIDRISDHTIIYDNNNSFWIIYVILGIGLPLFLNYLYNKRKPIYGSK